MIRGTVRASSVLEQSPFFVFSMSRIFPSLLFAFLTLFGIPAGARSLDSLRVDTLAYHGHNAIDFVLLADGYTCDEQSLFLADARRCFDYLFRTSPFDHYRSYFNLYAIPVVSRERGISHPGVRLSDGTCACPEDAPMPLQRRDTYFRLSLDFDGIHRLMGCGNDEGLHRILRRLAPHCRQVGILANTDEYGGMGGDILLATRNKNSREVFVHELGHSFAHLADEYFAGDDFFESLPNMSSDSLPSTVRWRLWLDVPGVDIYPYQGSEKARHWFKPTESVLSSMGCKMQALGLPFCPVCREAIVEQFHALCNPIEAVAPVDSVVYLPVSHRASQRFALTHLLEARGGHTHIVWRVDGRVAQVGGKTFRLSRRQLRKSEPREVSVSVSDESEFVRSPEHALRHVYTHTWRISPPSSSLPSLPFRRGKR